MVHGRDVAANRDEQPVPHAGQGDAPLQSSAHSPQEIIDDRDVGIVLRDGTRLSARVWMPVDAPDAPVPAVLEYLPYRKSDGTAERDQGMHPYVAARGYACLRVDRRGCGDSQGLFDDEYSEQELQDGVEIIEWIAAQPWCTGAVGMQGISWGGFNSLQIAARAPEALKAVIAIGSTVDRYADDIHYKGGVELSENIGWAATVLSWFSLPPDPALVGDNWRDIWLDRLENTPFLARTWSEHPTRDAYWKHGSVCEDYDAIKAAVLVFGGFHDGYRNTMAHLAENLSAPVKAVAGPWGHKYPHISNIAPSIGYLQEAVRWWDHWLKGVDRGVDDDPAYRAYVMDSARPAPGADHRSGRWIAERDWPSPRIAPRRLHLRDGKLDTVRGEAFSRNIALDLTHGEQSGEYFTFGFGPGELPDDQMPDDARAACFDSQPLEETLDIVGAPLLSLRLSADQPRAQIVVRLCDVRPDGTSMLVSMGLLNLRHRNGFAQAEDLVPGESFEIGLRLDQTAYRVPAGHRLRIAVAASYWPYAWPEGRAFSLTLEEGALDLPLRPLTDGDEWHFPPPESARPRRTRTLRQGGGHKRRTTDPDTGKTVLSIYADHGRIEDLENGLIVESAVVETWSIRHDDPASAEARIEWSRSLGRGEWQVSTRATTTMRAGESGVTIRQLLEASEQGVTVFAKELEHTAPR